MRGYSHDGCVAAMRAADRLRRARCWLCGGGCPAQLATRLFHRDYLPPQLAVLHCPEGYFSAVGAEEGFVHFVERLSLEVTDDHTRLVIPVGAVRNRLAVGTEHDGMD